LQYTPVDQEHKPHNYLWLSQLQLQIFSYLYSLNPACRKMLFRRPDELP
jgi:hypothetical protein